jgi:hypothetical protein
MGILNSPIIEVGIGLILLYLVFGLIVTPINEFVSQAFHLRAEMLWGAIRSLLHDRSGEHAAKELYNHHLIRSLAIRIDEQDIGSGDDPNLRGKPSYIPAEIFSLALMDLIAKPAKTDNQTANATPEELLASLPGSRLPAPVQQALSPLIRSASGTIEQARTNIEAWYDAAMDRTSGAYKRRIQKTILFIGFLLAFLLNADSLQIANRLWANPLERAQIVEAAKNVPNPSGGPSPAAVGASIGSVGDTQSSNSNSNLLNVPPIPPALQELLGWSGPVNSSSPYYVSSDPRRFPKDAGEWLLKLIGLALTAFAASLGAPFWFDILNKVVNVRATGPSPQESQKKAAK